MYNVQLQIKTKGRRSPLDKRCPFGLWRLIPCRLFLELEFLETVKDGLDAREEIPRIEDLIELLSAERALGVCLETLAIGGAIHRLLDVFPHSHGVALHDGIGRLAGDARVDKSKQDLAGEDEAARAVEVVLHLLGVHLQAVEHPLHLTEHVVKRDELVGKGYALGTGVRDVALIPQGNVVIGNLGVCLHDTRKTAHALGGDGVALVRHGG